MVLILGEMYQVHAILFGIDGLLRGPLLTVIYYNLVIRRGSDDVHPIVGVMNVRYLLLIFFEHFCHSHGPRKILVSIGHFF